MRDISDPTTKSQIYDKIILLTKIINLMLDRKFEFTFDSFVTYYEKVIILVSYNSKTIKDKE
jgi:hypothetical protein